MKKVIMTMVIFALILPLMMGNASATLTTSHSETPSHLYVGHTTTLYTNLHSSSWADPSQDELWINLTTPAGNTINLLHDVFDVNTDVSHQVDYTPSHSGDYTVYYDYVEAPDQTGYFHVYVPDLTIVQNKDTIYPDETDSIKIILEANETDDFSDTIHTYIVYPDNTQQLLDTWSVSLNENEAKDRTVSFSPDGDTGTFRFYVDFSYNDLDRNITFNVIQRPPPESQLTISPTSAYSDEEVSIRYSITTTDDSGSFSDTIHFYIRKDGGSWNEIDTWTISVPASSTQTHTILYTANDIGSYEVFADSSNDHLDKTSSFTTQQRPPPEAQLSISPNTIYEDQSVEITYQITTTSDSGAFSDTIYFYIDDGATQEQIATWQVSVPSNDMATKKITYHPERTGTFTVVVDSSNDHLDKTGSFTAIERPPPSFAVVLKAEEIYINENAEMTIYINTTTDSGRYEETVRTYLYHDGTSIIDTWETNIAPDQTGIHIVNYIPRTSGRYTFKIETSDGEFIWWGNVSAYDRPDATVSVNPDSFWQGNETVITYTIHGNSEYTPEITVRARVVRPDGSYYYTYPQTMTVPPTDQTESITWTIRQNIAGDYQVSIEDETHGINTATVGFTVVVNPVESVENHPPVAFASSESIVAYKGHEIKFYADADDGDGFIVNYTWDFGDGTVSYEKDPIHIYEKTGKYKVHLTVVDNDGDTAESDLEITVINTNETISESRTEQKYLGIPAPYMGVAFIVVGGIFIAFNLDSLSKKQLLHVSFFENHGDIAGAFLIIIGIEELLTGGLIQRLLGTLLGF